MVEDVAGYRVLRSAGHGNRARMLLGFDEGRTVVLKVTAADDPRAVAEIEALERAAGEHVVVLEDVAIDENETVLVLERLESGTLAELLERRRSLDAGEAVTILAPVAATIDRIHTAGVAHGGLALSAICFRHDGAPTLTGFGGAEFFAAGSPEVVCETVAGVVADREALRAIAGLVLERVVGTGAAAARSLAAAIGPIAPADLADRLFDLASAVPVRFEDSADDSVTARMGELREPELAGDARRSWLPPWISILIPDGLEERLTDAAARIAEVWTGWEPRRRRLVLGLAAGGLTVFGAVALVPAAPGDATAAGEAPTPSSSPVDEQTLPDDPVEAAVLLLEARDRCLRDLSLLCLEDVVQPESAAYADDVALIRGVQAGGEYPAGVIVAGDPVLVERLGDAALLDLPPGSDPASVLLMRSTDGWRIRDYLEAPADAG